mmetsp:Transcript_63724/g.151902  ORF Transcript_63724/g.151902 Transcript_63724/m.151902 type:complete len:82 (-) Transcript_63724:121-366(-)
MLLKAAAVSWEEVRACAPGTAEEQAADLVDPPPPIFCAERVLGVWVAHRGLDPSCRLMRDYQPVTRRESHCPDQLLPWLKC